MPRFAFEKFKQADDRLTTQMKSVGEVMAIGRTFQESLQKALRGLETRRRRLQPQDRRSRTRSATSSRIRAPSGCGTSPTRSASGCRSRRSIGTRRSIRWFLAQIKEIVDTELALEQRTLAELDAGRAARR